MTEAEQLFADIANGDEAALQFIRLWSSYCHLFDDLIDGDLAPTAIKFAECENLLARLLSCEFFKRHSEIILVLRIMISEAHTASEYLRALQGRERDWGLFLSHSGNDMLRFVAVVTGGEKHLASISARLRNLTLKEHYNNG